MTAFSTPEDFKTQVVRALGSRQRRQLERDGRIPAAVLMPFYEKNGAIHILLTERTCHVAHHKGQISFPGGAQDPGDTSLLATALRESQEEIGLDETTVEVLGTLDDTPTVASPFLITPFVAFLNRTGKFDTNPMEVRELVEVPLEDLLNTRYIETEIKQDGKPRVVLAYKYNDHIIWGATARLLNEFLSLVATSRKYS